MIGLRSGDLTERVEFQAPTLSKDAAGIETVSGWAKLADAWVAVRQGNGTERREAAAEAATATATFVARWTPTLGAVTETARILWNGTAYAIHAIAGGRRGEGRLEFTATMRKDGR